jgi:SAM-dependent methyltransferase
MTDTSHDKNSRYWEEFWHKATLPAKDRGPMQVGFWDNKAESFGRNMTDGRREKKLKTVLDLINSTGLDLAGAEVLDIGAGTGALAIPLAKMGARVTVVDFSAEMLKRLNQRAEDENVILTRTVLASWDKIDLDAEGFCKKFDLVIASMTPAVQTPDAFNLMLEASRGICFYSGWVDRKRDPAFNELYRTLFNQEFREGSHGFYLPFMDLYLKGYRRTVTLRQEVQHGDETVDEMVNSIVGFFSATKDIDTAMRNQIHEFILTRSKDGKYYSESVATTGMMVWDMRDHSPS